VLTFIVLKYIPILTKYISTMFFDLLVFSRFVNVVIEIYTVCIKYHN